MAIITPFNFPLEIPALQLMGALYMGNKPLLHVDRRCKACVDLIPFDPVSHSDYVANGPVVGKPEMPSACRLRVATGHTQNRLYSILIIR